MSIGSDVGSAGGAGSTGEGPPPLLLEVLDWAARREAAKNDAGFPGLECCGTFVVVLVVVLLVVFGVLLLLDDDMMEIEEDWVLSCSRGGTCLLSFFCGPPKKNEACIHRITTATPCTTTMWKDPMDQCWLRRRRSLPLGYDKNFVR